MADGALDRFPAASLAVAVTGIAGPDGGSEEKPVGLTYVARRAARRPGGRAERHAWPHDRDGNKAARRRWRRCELGRAPSPPSRRRGQARRAHPRHRHRRVRARPGSRSCCSTPAPGSTAATRTALRRTRLRSRPPAFAVRSGTIRRTCSGVERVAITPGAARAAATMPSSPPREAAGLPIVTWQALLGELMAAPGRIGLGGHGHARQVDHHRAARAPADRRRAGPDRRGRRLHPGLGRTVRPGDGAPFLVEADEFGDNFLNYHPAGAIVTNVEMDHPDYFADARRCMDSFERFVRGMGTDPALAGGCCSTAADDPRCRRSSLARLGDWDGRGSFATGPVARSQASDVALTAEGSDVHAVRTAVRDHASAGEHNVLNATAALALARELGADLERPGRGPARRSPEPDGAWS